MLNTVKTYNQQRFPIVLGQTLYAKLKSCEKVMSCKISKMNFKNMRLHFKEIIKMHIFL